MHTDDQTTPTAVYVTELPYSFKNNFNNIFYVSHFILLCTAVIVTINFNARSLVVRLPSINAQNRVRSMKRKLAETRNELKKALAKLGKLEKHHQKLKPCELKYPTPKKAVFLMLRNDGISPGKAPRLANELTQATTIKNKNKNKNCLFRNYMLCSVHVYGKKNTFVVIHSWKPNYG